MTESAPVSYPHPASVQRSLSTQSPVTALAQALVLITMQEAQKPAAKYALFSSYASHTLSQDVDARKRKITDRNLPNALLQSPEFAEDSAMYRDLLQMERKLDWTMTRKRVEVHDALQRIIPVSNTEAPSIAV